MKNCPFCAEEIQDEALYCRFCNHDLKATANRPADTPSLVFKNEPINISSMPYKEILFSFKGRIGKKIYWISILFLSIALIIIDNLSVPFVAIYFDGKPYSSSLTPVVAWICFLIYLFFVCILMFSYLAVSIKRWHDINKSWLWMLISFLPSILCWMMLPVLFWRWEPFISEIPILGKWWSFITSIPIIGFVGFLKGTDGPNNYNFSGNYQKNSNSRNVNES